MEIPTPLALWVALAVAVLDGVCIGMAVLRAHGVHGTLAWIFAILAFPGVGALLYLLAANPSVRRTRRRKERARARVRGGDPRAPAEGTAAPESIVQPERGSPLHLVHELTGLPPSAGNTVELLSRDVAAFASILRAIDGARHSIWAEFYIVQNDATGKAFLGALTRKAAEGVEVRLLYDAVGSLSLSRSALEELEAAGGRTEAFLPVNPLRRRWAVHLRNHRKIVVVDGELGFTGGMNVGDEYSGRARRRGEQHFRDTHLALRGPAVRDLALIFAEDWSFATEEPLALPPRPAPLPQGAALVGIVPSGPDQRHNASGLAYFACMSSASERLYLSSPYFIPDEATTRALVAAALRGVDVRILVPAHCDVWLVGVAARTYYAELIDAGALVFEYLPAMLHAKLLVVDGQRSIVGSANVDMRSFQLNFELSALVEDEPLARAIEAQFALDLAVSRAVTRAELDARSLLQRAFEGVVRLFSPLL